jgi:hypothetical protein
MSAAAVLYAIDAFKNPSRYRSGKPQATPDGMLEVIKIVAGDEATLARVSEDVSEPSAVVAEAARNYLLMHMLDPRAQGLKLLGLKPGCSVEEMKDHKRWLLKWLHPDRNPSKWESSLFARVSALKLDELQAASVAAPVEAPADVRQRRRGDPRKRRHTHSVSKQRHPLVLEPGTTLANMRPYAKYLALTACLLLSVFILMRSGFFDSTMMGSFNK